MSNEYLPLAEHLKGEGLQEGTVLELGTDDHPKYRWTRDNFYSDSDGSVCFNPFDYLWRIVSTPPKKITFEAVVSGALGYKHTRVPDYAEFKAGDTVIVTVEEKR